MLHGHGGDIYSLAEESGSPLAELMDFSSNVSPVPLPESFNTFLSSCLDQVSMLPEVDSLSLRKALSARYGLLPENFIVCAGTTEWIYRIARVAPVDRVVIPLPAYSDYMDAAALAGRRVVKLGPWPDGDPRLNDQLLGDICSVINPRTLVYLCNPNNPTGRFFKPDTLSAAMGRTPEALWVVDESYAPFIAGDPESSLLSLDMPSNCIILRSFSKIYRIPGLRLGYIAGRRETIVPFSTHLLPWAVGRLAQLAGEFLLKQGGYEDAVRSFWRSGKRKFLCNINEVKWLGYVPGDTHFMLFRLSPPWSARSLTRTLRSSGILIRDCSNFQGLGKNYVRISLRSDEENTRLADRLKAL